LEKWYGVEIIVKNESIISDIYQGEFQNESLENVLTGMSFTSGFQFAIDGKKVYIN